MGLPLSFEFFPPKTPDGAEKLRQVRQKLYALQPEFCSVTYGAGGSTQDGTLQTVQAILDEGQQGAPAAEGQEQQTVAHTAESLLVAERAVKESLMAQVRQLEADNRALREDLGFFEKLIPAARAEGLSIRSLQAEVLGGMQLRWQVLVIQAARNAPEFNGRLELVLTGTQDGSPWTQTRPAQGQPLQVRQYRRIDGVLDLPPGVVVKTVTARVLEGTTVRAVQAMPLD